MESVFVDEFYEKQESNKNALRFCKILLSISQTLVLTSCKKRENRCNKQKYSCFGMSGLVYCAH